MKRNRLNAALCIMAALFIFLKPSSSSALDKGTAEVKNVKGVVFAKKVADDRLLEVSVGLSLSEGDAIETMSKSYTDVVFARNKEELVSVRIEENTKVLFNMVYFGSAIESIELAVPTGKVLIIKNKLKKPSELRLVTPSGTVAAEGMGFELL